MEAPKCKLCGERHYGLCSKGGDAPGPKHYPGDDKPPVVSPKPAAGAKPKFDRNAYQRELMRKRRAKDKEQP